MHSHKNNNIILLCEVKNNSSNNYKKHPDSELKRGKFFHPLYKQKKYIFFLYPSKDRDSGPITNNMEMQQELEHIYYYS